MKRRVVFIIPALILMISMTAWAVEGDQIYRNDPGAIQNAETVEKVNLPGEDISLTVSLKLWRTKLNWKTTDFDEFKGTANVYGPSANLTIKNKFYGGISYYKGSFEFSLDEEDFFYDPEFDAEKTDFDLWAGYSFHPRGSVFLGYKDTSIKMDADDIVNAKMNLKGAVIGVSGNYPISDSSCVLFGMLGYASLDADYRDNYGDTDLGRYKGPALELGVVYIFHSIPNLSLTVGYKYNKYQPDSDEDEDKITFSGFTLGVNYRL